MTRSTTDNRGRGVAPVVAAICVCVALAGPGCKSRSQVGSKIEAGSGQGGPSVPLIDSCFNVTSGCPLDQAGSGDGSNGDSQQPSSGTGDGLSGAGGNTSVSLNSSSSVSGPSVAYFPAEISLDTQGVMQVVVRAPLNVEFPADTPRAESLTFDLLGLLKSTTHSGADQVLAQGPAFDGFNVRLWRPYLLPVDTSSGNAQQMKAQFQGAVALGFTHALDQLCTKVDPWNAACGVLATQAVAPETDSAFEHRVASLLVGRTPNPSSTCDGQAPNGIVDKCLGGAGKGMKVGGTVAGKVLFVFGIGYLVYSVPTNCKNHGCGAAVTIAVIEEGSFGVFIVDPDKLDATIGPHNVGGGYALDPWIFDWIKYDLLDCDLPEEKLRPDCKYAVFRHKETGEICIRKDGYGGALAGLSGDYLVHLYQSEPEELSEEERRLRATLMYCYDRALNGPEPDLSKACPTCPTYGAKCHFTERSAEEWELVPGSETVSIPAPPIYMDGYVFDDRQVSTGMVRPSSCGQCDSECDDESCQDRHGEGWFCRSDGNCAECETAADCGEAGNYTCEETKRDHADSDYWLPSEQETTYECRCKENATRSHCEMMGTFVNWNGEFIPGPEKPHVVNEICINGAWQWNGNNKCERVVNSGAIGIFVEDACVEDPETATAQCVPDCRGEDGVPTPPTYTCKTDERGNVYQSAMVCKGQESDGGIGFAVTPLSPQQCYGPGECTLNEHCNRCDSEGAMRFTCKPYIAGGQVFQKAYVCTNLPGVGLVWVRYGRPMSYGCHGNPCSETEPCHDRFCDNPGAERFECKTDATTGEVTQQKWVCTERDRYGRQWMEWMRDGARTACSQPCTTSAPCNGNVFQSIMNGFFTDKDEEPPSESENGFIGGLFGND